MNDYPEYILRKLRQREGLEEEDTSMDTELKNMSPSVAFNEVCTWEGLCGYGDTIEGWIADIYGIDLQEITMKER
jgi:hypothetical protein